MPTEQLPPGFSRETTIRLDREGVFWHDGQRVTHPGLARAFASWIDVDPETGRYILRNAINWAYITVEDTPMFVRTIDEHDVMTLSDGTQEKLDRATLRLDDEDVPYCDVRGGKMPARFLRPAAFALLDQLESSGELASVKRVTRR